MREELTRVYQDTTYPRQAIDDGFTELCGTLDATIAWQQQVIELLTSLIDRQGA